MLILFPEEKDSNHSAAEQPKNETMETNDRFASYGFTSPVFFVQQATFVASFVGTIALYWLVKLIAKLLGGEWKVTIEKKLMSLVLSLLMRVMISYSSPVCTSLILSFKFGRLDSVFNVVSFVTSFAFIISLFGLSVYIAIFLVKNMERLSDDDFEPRYKCFYDRLKRTNPYAVIFNEVMLCRRMIVALTLGLSFSPNLQVFLIN